MKMKFAVMCLALAAMSFPPLLEAVKDTKPKVIVNLNDNNGLTTTPVPTYPEEAARQGWGGVGLFKLQFSNDGSVGGVAVLISTEHEVLDRAAKASLAKWRCQPGALQTANITISFRASKSQEAVVVDPDSNGTKPNDLTVFSNIPYPYAARRLNFSGSGVFMLHFRPDGSVDKAFPARSTGNAAVDAECALSFSKWRCRPGAYRAIFVPITLTSRRSRGR